MRAEPASGGRCRSESRSRCESQPDMPRGLPVLACLDQADRSCGAGRTSSLAQPQDRAAAGPSGARPIGSGAADRSDHSGDVPARAARELPKRLDVARAAERRSAGLPPTIEQQLRESSMPASKAEQVLATIEARFEAVSGATIERNSDLPEKISEA